MQNSGIFRRLLPAAALSRIFFPSSKELIAYFGQGSLPEGEYHIITSRALALIFPSFFLRLWW
jgi:hypothetical protein